MSSKTYVPALDSDKVLRYVEIDSMLRGVAPYRLLLWDTYTEYSPGRPKLGCAFYRSPDTEPFMVSYCGPGMGASVDDDEMVQCALGCFTMRPEDTDTDWFAEYTPEQMEWAESYECETLAFLHVEAGLSEIGALPEGDGIQWLESDGVRRLVYRECSTYTPAFRDLLDW